MPEHVHVVVKASNYPPPRIIGHFKRDAAIQLLAEDLHPFQSARDKNGKLPSCWAENSWQVYLDDETDVRRAIRYVEWNPLKEGKRQQRWSFVTSL